VIVPAANTQNLVLRDEVADAVAAGNFHIWTVKTVDEAVALFTGMESGLDEHGALPADIDGDTVYGRVIATLNDFDEALAKRHL
jgi:Lon-like ATP-dependent protease